MTVRPGETLREAGWRVAQSQADHAKGYAQGKADALAGYFDICATCGHERMAHYDGGDCGEEECPQNCVRFSASETEAR